jgi:hypothetical protein
MRPAYEAGVRRGFYRQPFHPHPLVAGIMGSFADAMAHVPGISKGG